MSRDANRQQRERRQVNKVGISKVRTEQHLTLARAYRAVLILTIASKFS